MAGKTVLITGCSSGIGRLSALTFQKQGWNVAATMRNPDKETQLTSLDNVLVMPLDVTDAGSIHAAIQKTTGHFGSLDVVVNNAGRGMHAPLEVSTDDMIREIFETNVFGVMRVCRAAIPVMRKQGSGCLINVTSMAGYIGLPLETTYCATKFAVEGMTEALAWEMKPFNIRVTSVAPGAYLQTSFSSNANDGSLFAGDPELEKATRGFREHFMAAVRNEGGDSADPQAVADQIYKCAIDETPVSNPVGTDAALIVSLMEFSREEFLGKVKPFLLPPQWDQAAPAKQGVK